MAPNFLTLKHLENYIIGYRGFEVESFLPAKLQKINNFFISEGLDAAVMGLSGGVDSALVLSLLSKASLEPSSSIKKIIALSLPINNCSGTTDQNNAERKAKLVYDSLSSNDKIEFHKIDLQNTFDALLLSTAGTMNVGNEWSNGQLVSVLRTPVFYHQAAILQTKGYKSIVVGTTNRDEGAYIGFYGKASDGMVDLQVIGDMHKSEVWKLSRHLNIPEEIISAIPKGDVWDGRCDEEMMGVPYWFLEMYQHIKTFRMHDLLSHLAPADYKEYNKMVTVIESVRKTNLHKYLAGSPSRYVDVLNRIVP